MSRKNASEILARKHYYRLKILYSFYEKYSRLSLSDLLAFSGLEGDVVRLGNGLVAVVDRRFRKGFITGSDISSYVYCPRLAYLKWLICAREGYNGVVASEKGLKAIAVGRILHGWYAEYVAEGVAEFLVYDLEGGFAGHIDELRLLGDKVVVVELKTGSTTYRGQEYARAQLQFYMYLLAKNGVERLHGVLLTRDDPARSFRAWDVPFKETSRVRGIVRGLRKNIILEEPPSRRSCGRCLKCILRKECRKLVRQ